MNKTPSQNLLQKYLTNSCTDSERRFVDEWYRSLQLESEEKFTSGDEERLLGRIKNQMAETEQHRDKPLRINNNWWVYAVGIAAILILSLGFLYYNPLSEKSETADQISSSATVKKINTEKKPVRYLLPDQTVVWLQPGASIEHATSFDGKPKREITFEGEAFFNVSKDKNHPFIIHSGKLNTEVVGTSFNVRANRNDITYQISVVTGSVAVSSDNPDEKVLLKPSQQAVFVTTTNNLTMKTLESKSTDIENWQPVSLNFDNVPLQEITDRLQKTFRVSIMIKNPNLRQCILKVGFDQQNLPEILEMINALLGFYLRN